MANTALNRTGQFVGTNKSGGDLTQGAVVILDNTNNNGFTTTTSAALSTRGIYIIIEPNGIANNASGMIAGSGWAAKVNLNTSATVGQFIKTHTVAGQATPHASPQVEGDFGVVIDISGSATSPVCWLFGSPVAPTSGSGITQLTSDVTAGPGSGSVAATIANNAVTYAKFQQVAGLSVVGVTGSATANATAITAATDGYVLRRVSSSSMTFAVLSGELLGYTQYNPGTLTDVSTTSTSGVDVDATNLSVVFTVPASGNVLVRFASMGFTSAGDIYWWCARTTGGANISGSRVFVTSATFGQGVTRDAVITGLTPGTSTTWRWGHGVSAGTGHIRYGDDGTASVRGPAVISVYSAP